MSFQSITTWATSMSPLWAARRGTTEKRICFYSVMLSETPLGWIWKSIQGWAKEVGRERWLDYQGRCNAGVEEGFWDCGQAGERRSLSPLYPSPKCWHLFSSLGSYKVSKFIPQGCSNQIRHPVYSKRLLHLKRAGYNWTTQQCRVNLDRKQRPTKRSLPCGQSSFWCWGDSDPTTTHALLKLRLMRQW